MKKEYIIIIVIIVLVIGLSKMETKKTYDVKKTGIVGVDCPIFRSNVASLVPPVYSHPWIWIATDCNNDGVYEAYGSPDSSFQHQECVTTYLRGQTPEGNNYYCIPSSTVQVYNGNDCSQFQIGYGRYYQADLNCGCTPSCAGKVCGDDGCSGSCGTCGSGTCSNGQCVTCNTLADNNPCNGCVDNIEFTTYKNLWKQGIYENSQFTEVKNKWKLLDGC